MLKQLMIPVAAFAITATGVSAFTGLNWADRLDLNLSDEQLSAFEEAREIRQEAQIRAQEVLDDAGIDIDTMRSVRGEMRELQRTVHEEMWQALEDNDYDAFIAAIEDSPLAGLIDSEAKFNQFVEAHNLRQDGDYEGAEDIMSQLGLEGPHGGMMGGHRATFGGPGLGEGRQSAKGGFGGRGS